MSGPWHMTGRAAVSMRSPQAHAICDRCGFEYLRAQLSWQLEWSGVKLQNLRLLVCKTCLDIPQPALKTIIIPPDPLPVLNPRPEQSAVTVPSFIATETPAFGGADLATEGGDNLIWEIEDTPLPDPNNPALYPAT
jgi:hypothetical protein